MSKNHDDGVDPTEGILADLASLRASREAADTRRDADSTALSALDEIAEAAGRLREPRTEDVQDRDDHRDDTQDDDAHDEAPVRAPRSRRAPVRTQAPADRGLFFTAGAAEDAQDQTDDSDDSDDDHDEEHDGEDGTAATPVVDPRNPFSHSSAADASSYAPIAVPAGGGLLFQPPAADLAEKVEDSWYDDEDDHDDDDDRDGGSGDDHDADDHHADDHDSDDENSGRGGSSRDGDDHDGEGRSRSRRRRGGRGRRSRSRGSDDSDSSDQHDDSEASDDSSHDDSAAEGTSDDSGDQGGRRGGRRGRRRSSSSDDSAGSDGSSDGDGSADSHGGQSSEADSSEASGSHESSAASGADDSDDDSDDSGSRRRRRRRGRGTRSSGGNDSAGSGDDQVTAIKGSTRLEAKRQRRREGREAGRRRPLLTEAEFLARRESVTRTMLVREQAGRTQLVVMEDGIAVEHYLSEHTAQASLIGNVYLGRVQNVLPSMEAAFIDIGKGRNAVLYAGEVNWDALGMNGKPQRIEQALSAGDPVLVQVTKDPVGHKGARLTSQISLPGRFLVYIPGNSMTGISRKLPDNERARLKKLLKEILPEKAGVIVRTAAEGSSDEELGRDVERLTKRWDSIQQKANAPKAQAPRLLYSEPDMIVRIIRDVFNEDFDSLVIDGDGAWDTIHEYVEAVAPDLLDRVSRYGTEDTPTAEAAAAGTDIFDHFRVNEQVEKALSRKVNLPSGGSLVIDRTEAMTVVDVNTGKFTGSGGNLEETVTKNNLEAAEEVIRQLRLRDIGGIIVVDFIDMVLESNRDLVTRRLVECLARDRTRHQVAEVTSLGLVQMTRKRIGTGLAESFAAAGEDMSGRGLMLPGTDEKDSGGGHRGGGRGNRRSRGGDQGGRSQEQSAPKADPEAEKKQDQSRSAVAAIAAATIKKSDDQDGSQEDAQPSDDGQGAHASTDQHGSTEQHGSEEQSPGRRSRRRGGRSRGRNGQGRSAEDAQQQAQPEAEKPATEKSATAEPATEHPPAEDPAPQEPEAWQAFVPAADSGPAPFMIGADTATTVQTQPAADPTPAPEPATASAEEAEGAADAADGAQDAAGEQAASQPQAPALPFLMLGMDD